MHVILTKACRKGRDPFQFKTKTPKKNVKNPNPKTMLACKDFEEKNHNFNKHAKFIIIDRFTNTTKT